ncbi:MAG: TIGR03564 family F420-dependent LLM class oxidoreductase, partial [Candidatus Rokuibacteriota bacterium]
MRIGLMIGSDKERSRSERMAGLIEDARAIDRAGFTSLWLPQVPGYLDAMTALAAIGQATERIELGTSIVPIQTRHPVIMAQQALTTQALCAGRFALGLGTSHHWIVQDQLGLPYERPAALMRDYLEILGAAFAGPGRIDVENTGYRVHSPLDVTDATPMPILIAALAPVMLRIAGEHASGTILWLADERAVAEHVIPRITRAASETGRRPPRIVAGVPITLCRRSEVEAAREYAAEILGHAHFSPNYVRILEHGDARDVGDMMAAGDEEAILARLRRFRDAGVTDLAA